MGVSLKELGSQGPHFIIFFLTHLFPKGRQLVDMKDQPSPLGIMGLDIVLSRH